MDLTELTAHQASALLGRAEISSAELTRAYLDRIERLDGVLQSYLAVMADAAMAQARFADETRRRMGKEAAARMPLLGLPIAIKDVICVAGAPTTCGSKILENFHSPYEATVIEKIRAAGMVILGKTNLDEFAMGSSTENSAYFTTRNPWDQTRVPGGSSGGSAAAVSAGLAPLALGSDTGGSVRQPASLCGVVGIRPSYGRVSRYGLVAYASSLDQIGTFAYTVQDAATLLSIIAGHDPRDSTSMPVPVPDYVSGLGDERLGARGLEGVRVGIPQEYLAEGLQPGVLQVIQVALAQLEELGAEVREISLPHTRYALPTYYLIAPAECSANLARYDGVRYGLSLHQASANGEPVGDIWEGYRRTREHGFGAEVKRRIMLGTFALSAGYYDAFYLKAQKVRTLIKQDFDQAFAEVDAVVGPTSPTTAFLIGERIDDPMRMYLSDVYTLSCNLAGICGLSVPCGFSDGLPVGLQIQGPAFHETDVIRIAHVYERSTPWHTQRPPIGS